MRHIELIAKLAHSSAMAATARDATSVSGSTSGSDSSGVRSSDWGSAVSSDTGGGDDDIDGCKEEDEEDMKDENEKDIANDWQWDWESDFLPGTQICGSYEPMTESALLQEDVVDMCDSEDDEACGDTAGIDEAHSDTAGIDEAHSDTAGIDEAHSNTAGIDVGPWVQNRNQNRVCTALGLIWWAQFVERVLM